MITGYHVIFGAYGHWLPNDPRGSWSDFVGSWDLYRYGRTTKERFDAPSTARPHDDAYRVDAKLALKYPAVEFTGLQARTIGRGFAEYIEKSKLTIWACAILPDHVHLVIARNRLKVEQVAIQFKSYATRALNRQAIHPFASVKLDDERIPQCWARGEWKVFLTEDEIPRAIEYVQQNPPKEGKPLQNWSFVKALV